MIENNCPVCGQTIYAPGLEPVNVGADSAYSAEVTVYLSVDNWERSMLVCTSCGKRFVAEFESILRNGHGDLPLGDLQKRLEAS